MLVKRVVILRYCKQWPLAVAEAMEMLTDDQRVARVVESLMPDYLRQFLIRATSVALVQIPLVVAQVVQRLARRVVLVLHHLLLVRQLLGQQVVVRLPVLAVGPTQVTAEAEIMVHLPVALE